MHAVFDVPLLDSSAELVSYSIVHIVVSGAWNSILVCDAEEGNTRAMGMHQHLYFNTIIHTETLHSSCVTHPGIWIPLMGVLTWEIFVTSLRLLHEDMTIDCI